VPGALGTASSDANDTTTFVRGTQSVRVTTAATGVQSQVRKTGLSAIDLTGKMIRILLKVDDVTHLNRMELVIGTSSFTNFLRWTVHTHSTTSPNYVTSGDWVLVQLLWAAVSAASGGFSIGSNGTPSTKTGFTDWQFNCYDDAVGAVTYHLQAIEIVPDVTNTFANGVVSITFDDSWSNVYDNARPKMDSLGYRGTLYTIADYIGTSLHLSMSQLRSMQNLSGWEVSGHAYTNANHGLPNGFSDLSAARVNDEFRLLKEWLVTNGFTGDNFAYPKGHFEVTTDGVPVDQIAAQYWATSRTIISETRETWPPSMPQRVHALTAVSEAATTPATIVGAGNVLDRCKNSGSWLILCLHQIVTGSATDSTMLTQTGFGTVMDGINSRGIPVLPVADVIRYYT
jgi:hypothetical protein